MRSAVSALRAWWGADILQRLAGTALGPWLAPRTRRADNDLATALEHFNSRYPREFAALAAAEQDERLGRLDAAVSARLADGAGR